MPSDPSSKVQVLAVPLLPPGTCALCGCAQHVHGFVDLQMMVEYYGQIYFCWTCAVQIGMAVGLIDPDVVKEQLSANVQLETTVEALKKKMQTYLPLLLVSSLCVAFLVVLALWSRFLLIQQSENFQIQIGSLQEQNSELIKVNQSLLNQVRAMDPMTIASLNSVTNPEIVGMDPLSHYNDYIPTGTDQDDELRRHQLVADSPYEDIENIDDSLTATGWSGVTASGGGAVTFPNTTGD
jgi:hypothetical protein